MYSFIASFKISILKNCVITELLVIYLQSVVICDRSGYRGMTILSIGSCDQLTLCFIYVLFNIIFIMCLMFTVLDYFIMLWISGFRHTGFSFSFFSLFPWTSHISSPVYITTYFSTFYVWHSLFLFLSPISCSLYHFVNLIALVSVIIIFVCSDNWHQ